MTTELYDDLEQGERVRTWLKENGSGILIGVALAIGAVFGYRQWQLREDNRHYDAARLYAVVQNALDSADLDAAAAGYADLGEYRKNLYRTLAGLQLAAAYTDRERPDEALAVLDELRRTAVQRELLPLIAWRQARLLTAGGQPARALELLVDVPAESALAALAAEARGDAYSALGRDEEALAAYREALDLSASERGLLNMKWQALASAVPPAKTTDDALRATPLGEPQATAGEPATDSGSATATQEAVESDAEEGGNDH